MSSIDPADAAKDDQGPPAPAAALPEVLQTSTEPTAPLREDQVANAVAFLTNPKVVV